MDKNTNKITNEIYKSIRYIIPIILIFVGIISLQNYKNILGFITTNIAILTGIATPFFIGFVIAYILNNPMKYLEKKFKLKRGICVALIYGGLAASIVFMWLYIIPIMQSNIADLYAYIPQGITEIENLINNSLSKLNGNINYAEVEMQINAFITNTLIPFTTSMASTVSQIILELMGVFISYTVNIFMGIVISIYLLLSKEKTLEIVNDLSRILLGRFYLGVKNFVNILDRNIGVYIVAKAIDSTIYGVLCTIILYIVGSKYPLVLGLIIGITNMIPFFGPIIGTIVVTLINLFFSFEKSILVLVVMVIAQQIESAVLEPYFVGKQVGVPPILTILAVTLAGKYTGFLGIILSVPITGVLLIYIRKFIESRKLKEN